MSPEQTGKQEEFDGKNAGREVHMHRMYTTYGGRAKTYSGITETSVFNGKNIRQISQTFGLLDCGVCKTRAGSKPIRLSKKPRWPNV